MGARIGIVVNAKQPAKQIENDFERIPETGGEFLQIRAVRAAANDIAAIAIAGERGTIGTMDGVSGAAIVAARDVEPAVRPEGYAKKRAVRVSPGRLEFEDASSRIADVVVVPIFESPNAFGTNDVKRSFRRKGEVHRVLQALGEDDRFLKTAVRVRAVRIAEDFDAIRFRAGVVSRRRVGVGFDHENAIAGIDGHADGRYDVRLGSKQAEFDTWVVNAWRRRCRAQRCVKRQDEHEKDQTWDHHGAQTLRCRGGRGRFGGGAEFVFDLLPARRQGGGAIGLACGKIEALGAVVVEVVEGVSVRGGTFGDEFPIADPEGAVVFVVEEEVFAGDFDIAFEGGNEAAARHLGCTGGSEVAFGAGEFEHRGNDVDDVAGGAAKFAARANSFRPMDDEER